MVYRDVTHGINLFWSWQKSESLQNLSEDFYQVYLLTQLNQPLGTISDWKSSIVTLVSACFPGIPHQRCLSHVVRELKRLLPAGSPFFFTKALREIACDLIQISDPSDYFDWNKRINYWLTDFGYLLKEKTLSLGETKKKSWYTHQNLRRAIKLMTVNQESLFAYLHHNFLPKTNNSLEGVNSQLKAKLINHRGMKTDQQAAFCFWLLTFSRAKTKEDLKKLWDYLKTKISAV